MSFLLILNSAKNDNISINYAIILLNIVGNFGKPKVFAFSFFLSIINRKFSETTSCHKKK